jgi:DNA repair exonuclease SbcCD nuclease subunit
MVRIVHTADVHLSADAPARQEALRAILSVASEERVDALTIGGDLFDSELGAERVRDSLREEFSDLEFPVVTTPGNHDETAFGADLFFGENFVPRTAEPFSHYVLGDDHARITCLPYTPRATDGLLVELRNREPFEGPEFLLVHCSLEAPVEETVGEEGEQRYCPVTKQQLAELAFDYYLAGHFHSRHLVELPNGSTFVYPGSPASITRTETGRRTAVLVDTEASQPVQPRYLETFHHDSLDLRVTLGNEETILEEIRAQVETWEERQVQAEITVDGYIAVDENEYETQLDEASGDVPLDNRTRTVAPILTHPLYERFREELTNRSQVHHVENPENYELDAFHSDLQERTLEVFAELAAEDRLS